MSYSVSLSRGTTIDTEKCVENIGNRFDMVLVAAARAREIRRKNRHSDRREHVFAEVTSLLEIQQGKIGQGYTAWRQKIVPPSGQPVTK